MALLHKTLSSYKKLSAFILWVFTSNKHRLAQKPIDSLCVSQIYSISSIKEHLIQTLEQTQALLIDITRVLRWLNLSSLYVY